MIRPAKIDAQLNAMAGSADRANRPTTLVIMGAGVVAVAAIFALWSGARFLTARQRLQAEMNNRAQVGMFLTQIASKKQETPDLDAKYPPLPFFDPNVHETALNVYGLSQDEKAKLPVAVRPRESPKPLTGTPGVSKTSVDVTFNAQPLEKIFALINAVQENKDLRTTFVSSINLTPITTGWNGTIRFGAYEKTK